MQNAKIFECLVVSLLCTHIAFLDVSIDVLFQSGFKNSHSHKTVQLNLADSHPNCHSIVWLTGVNPLFLYYLICRAFDIVDYILFQWFYNFINVSNATLDWFDSYQTAPNLFTLVLILNLLLFIMAFLRIQ